jgi:hypothetical protein
MKARTDSRQAKVTASGQCVCGRTTVCHAYARRTVDAATSCLRSFDYRPVARIRKQSLPGISKVDSAIESGLIAGLLYLQHAFDLSDEEVVWQWLENPYWQVFTGETYLQTEPPIDPSSLTLWRKRLGEAGVEELLVETIEAEKRAGVITASSVKRVIVDTSVMGKAITEPRFVWGMAALWVPSSLAGAGSDRVEPGRKTQSVRYPHYPDATDHQYG